MCKEGQCGDPRNLHIVLVKVNFSRTCFVICCLISTELSMQLLQKSYSLQVLTKSSQQEHASSSNKEKEDKNIFTPEIWNNTCWRCS